MNNSSLPGIPFGKHLMLDLYNCQPKVLNDKLLVEDILKSLPGKIGMTMLTPPVVVFANPNGKRDPGGWSGFVMIKESHISIHTFIKRRFVTIDVYSCKDFDHKFLIKYFKDTFQTKEGAIEVVVRGKKYPAEDIE